MTSLMHDHKEAAFYGCYKHEFTENTWAKAIDSYAVKSFYFCCNVKKYEYVPLLFE